RDRRRRGQLGELRRRLSRRQAEPLHQRASGHRDDGLLGAGGADAVQLAALVVDDGDQAQYVVITARHDHPPPLASPASPAQWAGMSQPLRCLEVCPAHDSYFRSTIGIDRTTLPNVRLAAYGAADGSAW